MATNIEYLNGVRNLASEIYQDRIPVATKENLAEVTQAILEYPSNKNEFIEVLTNRVSKTKFANKLYNNPYAMLKKGTLPYGESIEMVFVDLIKAKGFSENFGDSEVASLIGKEAVDNVKVEYYSENIRNKYKMTISNQQLKKAFMSEDGLHKLVNMMMVAPLNSAQYDEFIAMKKLINTIEMASVNISGYSALTDLEKAKQLTKLIKEQMYKFQFLGKGYNKQGVNTFCNPQDVVIFVKPEVKANIDVELLASAFHMDKAEVDGRLLLIDSFTKDNGSGTEVEDTETLCIVADKDLIQYYDTLNETESFRNADRLTTNIFHHRWAVAYGCGFVNALKIKAAE